MPNKTISIPSELVPVIESLEVPFSTWVATQLRRHAATEDPQSFAEQLLADAAIAAEGQPTAQESRAAAERMERSAPW